MADRTDELQGTYHSPFGQEIAPSEMRKDEPTFARFFGMAGLSTDLTILKSPELLLMALVALLACWNPAARSIQIDPARTLREE